MHYKKTFYEKVFNAENLKTNTIFKDTIQKNMYLFVETDAFQNILDSFKIY